MKDHSTQNKRIAKNTILLYVRMLITLLVSLYTSRLILQYLGVTDFGIYNVVGGIVIVLTFLNGAMSSASQRFITVEYGKGDLEKTREVFNSVFQIHSLLAVIIILLAETIGLWFLNYQLQIPANRYLAANIIYQFSIITCVFQIMTVPFEALIISHEKLNVFAWQSIFDAVLKLLLVLCLSILPVDKLMYHGLFMMIVFSMNFFIYLIYSLRNFDEVYVSRKTNLSLVRSIGIFTGWKLYGNVTTMLYTQGVNMLLNIFYGPAINAARAIGVQVQNTVHAFVFNFQIAAAPQITMTCANQEYERLHNLMFSCSKISFYLLGLISIPLLLETNLILTLWLKEYPAYSDIFVRLVVLIILADITAGPIDMAINATGDIMKYSIVVNTVLLMVLPLSYCFVRFDYPPQVVYVIHLLLVLIVQASRIIIVLPRIKLSYGRYIKEVLLRIMLVAALSIIIPIVIVNNMEEGFPRLLSVMITGGVALSIAMYYFGLSYSEKILVKNIVLSKIHTKGE